MYFNRAIVIGNLTRDPEMKALPSGISVTTFSIATNRVWKDKEGKQQESTDYHNIVVFGKQAETVAKYLKKGSSALVEGRMQTRSWDAQDGSKKYRTEIVADRIQFGTKTRWRNRLIFCSKIRYRGSKTRKCQGRNRNNSISGR